MKKNFLQRSFIAVAVTALIFVSIDACKKKHRSTTPPSGTPTMNSADNVSVSGQNVTLTYNTASQSNGFSISFSNVGSTRCAGVSIETSAAYGIVANGASFAPSPINTSMPQYTCTQSGTNITLSGAPPLSSANFRPWVDDFTITVGQTVFTVTTTVSGLGTTQTLSRGVQNTMNLDSGFNGCGLNGTVLQRVYDCSKMITNWGAVANPSSNAFGSTSGTYYTAFVNDGSVDSTLYWFVVSCPAGTGGSVAQQSCAYLTPIVESTQPALDTANTELFTISTMSNAYQNRLLFSGKMANGGSGYNFENVNGYPVGSSPYNQTYLYTDPNPGNGATTSTPTFTASVCITAGGGSLAGSGTMYAADATLRDSISSTTGATISWAVPSYPMLNILTGGTPTGGSAYCTLTSGGDRPYCDKPSSGSNVGFNAINIPGFSESGDGSQYEFMWSSSSSGVGYAWAFIPLVNDVGGFVNNGGNPSAVLGARCVSPAWF